MLSNSRSKMSLADLPEDILLYELVPYLDTLSLARLSLIITSLNKVAMMHIAHHDIEREQRLFNDLLEYGKVQQTEPSQDFIQNVR